MGGLFPVFPKFDECSKFVVWVYLRWFALADGLREKPCGIRVIVWLWLGWEADDDFPPQADGWSVNACWTKGPCIDLPRF